MEHSPDVCDLSGCATHSGNSSLTWRVHPLDGVVSGSDGNSLWLITDDDKDHDSSLTSLSQAAKPVAADRTVPASLDLDIQEVCKRMAAKLNISWPAVQVETTRSSYNGKRLPRMKKTGKQLLPVFPEVLNELVAKQRAKPYRDKNPIPRGFLLDCHRMNAHGLRQIPQVMQVVASHLHPIATVSASGVSLPPKVNHFQSGLMDKSYTVATLTVRAMNVSLLLLAYEAE